MNLQGSSFFERISREPRHMKATRFTRRKAFGMAAVAFAVALGAGPSLAGAVLPVPNPVTPPPAAPARTPNILFILIDDMGFGDLSLTGNRQVATPHIDALAR